MEDPQRAGSVPGETPYQSVPPAQSYSQPGYGQGHGQPPYGQAGFPPPTGYVPPSNGYAQSPYPPQGPVVPADQGLSDTAAGALAYVTIIPAIVFLVMAPYNTRPFVKFHAVQCLALAVCGFCLGLIGVIPFLGWIVWLVGMLALAVVWVMSIVKASQGSYMKLPVISEFASKQSGYQIV